jgi:aminoglycoside phosphotransferase
VRLDTLLGQPVAVLRSRPSSYRTSHRLEELDISLEDGSLLELVRKDLRRTELDGAVRRAKPAFLYDPRREIDAYRLLAGHDLGTPQLYDHGEDWLLLERVRGVELYQVGDIETWQQAARWLATLHERFAPAPPDSPHLLRYTADFYRGWAVRARRIEGAAALGAIVARYDAVVERLCALPVTLIHGEFYASNVLVDGGRTAPVDWEMAGIGPGLIDLAALTSGAWSDDERTSIASAYGVFDQEAFECCRLHLALQWLGWSREWVPPAAHAHDWLGEARRAAERLQL